MPNPVWFPGDLAPGSKVFATPVIFAQQTVFQKAPTFQGSAVFQAGVVNTAAQPVSPGTVATGGTVTNSLGYDAIVYASATTGISATKVGTASIPGSALAGQTTTYVVPGGQGITISYTGTLSWTWFAK